MFPNTFEYHFIAIELYKVARNPNALSARAIIAVAVGISIVVKLPQEWWIHVAQLDVTELLDEHLSTVGLLAASVLAAALRLDLALVPIPVPHRARVTRARGSPGPARPGWHDVAMIERARPDELDAVVALIADEQARPERNITYLGLEAAGIRAELDALTPDWTGTVRVARDGAAIGGVSIVEWDAELGRAWIQGPWVPGDDDAWARWSRPLVDAAIEQLPTTVHDQELCGEVANVRLAALAAELGWAPTETNHAFVLTADRAAEWDDHRRGDGGVRDLVADDLEHIRALHDAEFPNTYLPVDRIPAEVAAGDRIAVVTERGGAVTGYATGTVTPDGEGYIDFVAVHESARGTGAGRVLVSELSRRLLDEAPDGRVNLTVQEHRAPARALYERLGFVVDAAFRAYRTAADRR